jgi:hypothetical protein
MIAPGQRVAWSSWTPRRCFVGTVVVVRKSTAQIRLCGKRKMKYVKIARLAQWR